MVHGERQVHVQTVTHARVPVHVEAVKTGLNRVQPAVIILEKSRHVRVEPGVRNPVVQTVTHARIPRPVEAVKIQQYNAMVQVHRHVQVVPGERPSHVQNRRTVQPAAVVAAVHGAAIPITVQVVQAV